MGRVFLSLLTAGVLVLLGGACISKTPGAGTGDDDMGPGDDDTSSGDDDISAGDDDSGDPTDVPEQVLVVGAGLAGLAAARELHEHDCCDVIVLEALDRVGGRVATMQSEVTQSIFEASAQYHSGPNNSSLTPIIEAIGMQTEDFRWTHECWDVDGTYNPVSVQHWDRFYGEATMWSRDYEELPDVSLAAMIQEMDAAGEFHYLDNQREIDYCVATLFENEYCSDASDMRAWSLWEGDDLYGLDQWFPDGMSAIPEYLADGLDVRLNTVVSEVRYDADGVVVTAVSGAEYEADRVIVTVSLGVLKAGDIAFVPPLPSTNTDAIERLGMGLMDKVWLFFPEVFWDPEVDFKGYLSEPAGEYSSWNYYGGNGLLVWHAGTKAIELEFRSNEEIIGGAMDTLRIMYGEDIPEPTETFIGRFHPEAITGATPRYDFSKGAYSFLPLGATPDDRSAVATPVMDRVFFAGEHTDRSNPALIQGAYDSGIREAERIIDLL